MDYTAAKCSCCGANLQVDGMPKSTVCPFCGTPFISDQVNPATPSSYTDTDNEKHVVMKSSDFRIRSGELEEYCGASTKAVIPINVKSIGHSAFSNCTGLKTVVIPNSVETIGYSSFYGCSSLESITIPNSVKIICPNAFDSCTGLTEIIIPEGITDIGDNAFCQCSSLSSIVLPKSIRHIGSHAFLNCESLASIVIPSGVTELEFGTFCGCKSLTNVDLPDDLKIIGANSFSDCGTLKSLVIPNGVVEIGPGAFRNCKNLSNIFIHSGLMRIGRSAFEDCSSLTSITLPASLTSIDYYAFQGCIKLDTVNKPDSVRDDDFNGTPWFSRKVEESKKNQSGGCYIATAVYRSYDCPQVWTLRRFRDLKLAATRCGRAFIAVYYAVSPKIVCWFGSTRCFQRICRMLLDHFVCKLQKDGYESTPYLDPP